MKTIVFLGQSLKNISRFPTETKREVGYQLQLLQEGLIPVNRIPMSSIGAGVSEIRIIDQHNHFRVIYTISKGDKIFVLHSFQKKTQKTSGKDIEAAKTALKSIREGV